MSLRIRRGTDAQRQTLTFDQGEVVYTTDTKKVYVGDGITQGGVNILANSAGVGVTFNGTTQAFDFSTNNLGLTTSVISEGANKYYTTQRAQDAAASLFTSVGSPTSTGSVTGTITPSTIVLAVAPTNMVQGERIVISGTGGNGLSATTYYVVSVNSANVVLASTLANAMASTPVPISSLSTGSITGTTYAAGATDTGITFTYDSINHVMNVTASGVTSIVNDISPSLGGNLAIGNYNITSSGTGAISIAGNITSSTGNITATAGNITAGGSISAATITATTGLGANLSLNGYNLTGTGAVSLNVTSTFQTHSLYDGVAPKGYYSSIISRGTFGSPTAVNSGDELGGLLVKGYSNSSTSAIAGLISVIVDPTAVIAGGNYIKSIVAIAAATDTSQDVANAFTLNSAGVATSNAFVASKYTQLAVYANDTARTTAIPTPATGMMVFMTSGTSPAVSNKAVVYNGSAWAVMPG